MINFFTSCTGPYKMFVYPYISSILINVPNSFVEIIVDDLSFFKKDDITKLKDIFNNRFLIRNYRSELKGWERNILSNLQTNAIRFLELPTIECDSTYIGDIDMIILDSDIEDNHIKHCNILNLPYSNVKRIGQNRLSGLHFVKTKEYYNKITKEYLNNLVSDINNGSIPFNSDECLLFDMMSSTFGVPTKEQFGEHSKPDELSYVYRPVHGFHTSLNRVPLNTVGWEITFDRISKYDKMINSNNWKQVFSTFTDKYKITVLDKLSESIEVLKKGK